MSRYRLTFEFELEKPLAYASFMAAVRSRLDSWAAGSWPTDNASGEIEYSRIQIEDPLCKRIDK